MELVLVSHVRLSLLVRNITRKWDGETRSVVREESFVYPIILPWALGLFNAVYERSRNAPITRTLQTEQKVRKQSTSSNSVRLVNQHNVA